MGHALATLDTPALADLKVARDHVVVDRCEIVTQFQRLEDFAAQWERLWQTDPRAEIFQTFEWSRAWWHAFGRDYKLCALVTFAGDEVVGVVPLVQRDGFLQFLGTPEADYADIICEEHRAAQVLALALKTLMESVKGWKECAFLHLSKHSRAYRYYPELPRKLRARLRCVPDERQHTIILRNQREEVFKALLGKQHTRRIQNKLRKAGQLQFRHLDTAQEAAQYLPDFFRHHVRRHAALGRRSPCATPKFCQFLRELIQELEAAGRVRFGVLELNGQPLAWDFGFEVNGKFLLYQHTFDLDAWHYTPGELLLWNTLEYARDHIAREFDFGRGDEFYKDRFANYSRETFSLYAEPRSLAGRLRGLLRMIEAQVQPGLCRIKQIAKSRPAILRAFRELRLWSIGAWSGIGQARKDGSLLQHGLHLTRELFSRAIWSRRSTDVFASEASRTGDAGAIDVQDDLSRSVNVAQFGDLVDLAWQHPDIVSLNDLQQFRKRLKNGDRVYIVRESGSVVSLCWASSRPDAVVGPMPQPENTGGTPAIVVQEYWSARDHELSASYRLLLWTLTREAADRKAALLIHCGTQQPALRQELERQGFIRKFHTTQYKIFSHLGRESVSLYPKNTFRSSQLA